MKRIAAILIVSFLVLGSVFGSTYYHHHKWSDWYEVANKSTFSASLLNGQRVYTEPVGNGVTYEVRIYGLGSTNSMGTSAWDRYVDQGYRLKYIGGKYYASDSDDWSEPSNINSYLYPSYIDYLRPY